MYDIIAAHEGSGGTIWGPCTDGSKFFCDCPQCEHANNIEASGKDWNVEYEKARARNFDKEG